MLQTRIVAILLAALCVANVSAQNKKVVAAKAAETALAEPAKPEAAKAVATAEAEFKPLGFFGVAYAEGTYVLTCGGPKVGFTYGSFGMAAGLYPTLMYSDVYKNLNASTPWRPNLGAGIEISYKKIAIIAPVYYLPNNTYYYTIGIGYKF